MTMTTTQAAETLRRLLSELNLEDHPDDREALNLAIGAMDFPKNSEGCAVVTRLELDAIRLKLAKVDKAHETEGTLNQAAQLQLAEAQDAITALIERATDGNVTALEAILAPLQTDKTPAPLPEVYVILGGGVVNYVRTKDGQEVSYQDVDLDHNDIANQWQFLSEELKSFIRANFPNDARIAEGPHTPAEVYERRRDRLMEILESEPAIEPNGYTIPEQPGRYVALEIETEDISWAMDADDLESLKQSIDASDTSRDTVQVVDLDTGEYYEAIQATIRFDKIERS